MVLTGTVAGCGKNGGATTVLQKTETELKQTFAQGFVSSLGKKVLSCPIKMSLFACTTASLVYPMVW